VNEAGGEPISYLALEEGTEVLSSDGKPIGKVAHVLFDADDDNLVVIVVDATCLPGGHVFVDAALGGEIRTDAVTLKLDAEASRSLPKPTANPAAVEVGPDGMGKEGLGEEMHDKLRRAWDRISGNY
jgi:sporulation protein YlmC with PRC-barrel domain